MIVWLDHDSESGQLVPTWISVSARQLAGAVGWNRTAYLAFEGAARRCLDELDDELMRVTVPAHCYVASPDRPGEIGIYMPALRSYTESYMGVENPHYSFLDVDQLMLRVDDISDILDRETISKLIGDEMF